MRREVATTDASDDLGRIIPRGANVIEVSPPDDDLAQAILGYCPGRYLALGPACESREPSPATRPGVSPPRCSLDADRQVSQNNADVLVLSGAPLKYLANRRYYRHAKQVICAPRTPLGWLGAVPAWLCLLAARKLRSPRVVAFRAPGGGRRVLLSAQVRRPKKPGARCYISPQLGVRGFLEWLYRERVRYVLLRWFDDMERLPPGEDLDILVHDDDHIKVRAMLSERPGLMPCDLYSSSGTAGGDYLGGPYYPPDVADQILTSRVWHRGGCYVPSPRDYFFSLAYHAVYHKQERSGLSLDTSDAADGQAVDHDYPKLLASLALAQGIDVKITGAGLHSLLKEHRWSPPLDTLNRLARSSDWLAPLLPTADMDPAQGDLIVFVLREYATQHNLQDAVLRRLEQHRLDVIATKRLTPDESRAAARRMRGGNWSKGPWALSAGAPSFVIVAFDYRPKPPRPAHKKQYPHVYNEHVFVKHEIRAHFNATRPTAEQTNFIHSSDNEHEAWEYIDATLPESAAGLRAIVSGIRASWSPGDDVLHRIPTKCTRSKLEIIQYGHLKAVKKTFKRGKERFLAREIYVMQQFAARSSAIPPLLDAGPDYLVMPWYDDTLRIRKGKVKRLPVDLGREVMQVLRFFYEQGIALIDFQPRNVLVDRRQGLKIIDFEFLYQYGQPPADFRQSYDLVGVPGNFDGDLPRGVAPPGVTYATHWQPYFRVTAEELLQVG